jgi:hypothetical protein
LALRRVLEEDLVGDSGELRPQASPATPFHDLKAEGPVCLSGWADDGDCASPIRDFATPDTRVGTLNPTAFRAGAALSRLAGVVDQDGQGIRPVQHGLKLLPKKSSGCLLAADISIDPSEAGGRA